jgi:hypothetical protein
MPIIQAAFVCESFKQESSGFVSFNSVVQSLRVASLPGHFAELALGILITELPPDRSSSIEVALMGTDSFIELNGQLKVSITLQPSPDGFAQVAYFLRNVVIPTYDAYRFVFSFDGSPEIVHYAPFVVLPQSPVAELTDALRKTTRH